MGGSGAANALWIELGEAFNETHPDIVFEVAQGLGATGGARAMVRGAIDLAAMGREPTAAEAAQGVAPVLCGKTAFLFVANRDTQEDFSTERLVATYSERNPRWSDGTPMRLILRPRVDSDSLFLARAIPGLGNALDAARTRGEAPTAATDAENLSMLKGTVGAFGGMTMIQFRTQDHRLLAMRFNNVVPTRETVQDGSYPFQKSFCVARGPKLKASAEKFVAFLTGPVGARILDAAGLMAGTR